MQNKWRLPKDVRKSIVNMLSGLDRRRAKIREQERDICSVGGSAHTRAIVDGKDSYIYLPSSGASATSGVERQADRLAALHDTFDYRFVKAVELADKLTRKDMERQGIAANVRDKVIAQIYNSFKPGRNFTYHRTDLNIVGISRDKYYEFQHEFVFHIAKILKMD